MTDLTAAVAEARKLAPFQTGGMKRISDEERKQVIRNKLFHLGGPGSGFHGHRGRPGKVGGSSKGDRTLEDVLRDHDKGYEEMEVDMENLPPAPQYQKPDHRKRVEDAVNRLGYPIDQVESTEDQGYIFNVGDQTYRADGEYDPKTGKIRVFDIDQKTDSTLEGILAHEVQHSRWKRYHDAYQQQFIEVEKSVRATDDKSQWLIRLDGDLRYESDKERLWAYDLHEKYLIHSTRNWNRLQEADGVTDYSRAYWNKAEVSKSSFDYDRAVDETLAEIARLEVSAPIEKFTAVTPIWQEFYKRVRKYGSVTQNRLFIFGGQGSGHHGHSGRPGKVGGSSSSGGSVREVSKKERKKYYYHRSTNDATDAILQSGYIEGSEDNFAPEIYRGIRAGVGEEPVVFFGVPKGKLTNFRWLMTGPVASNDYIDTSLNDAKILVFDPSNNGYYDMTDFYQSGVKTENELLSIYKSRK